MFSHSHDWTFQQWRDALAGAAEEARTAGDPFRFLDSLRALHHHWHAAPRRLGFLIFHYYLLKHFFALGLDRPLGDRGIRDPLGDIFATERIGVRPFGPDDFAAGGRYASAGATVFLGQRVRTVDDLAAFSMACETWHNNVHGAIGQVDNLAALIDPEVNLYFPQFYKLHTFINNNFVGKLLGYALERGLVSPTITPDRWLAMSKDFIIRHIEEREPTYVARI